MSAEIKQVELPCLPPKDDAFAHWVGMPEFEQENQLPIKQVIVSFSRDEDIREFSRLVGQILTMRGKSSIWYPPRQRHSESDALYMRLDDE